MFVIVGSVVVFACVLGGYAAMGGKLYVLWQPFEAVIIVGAAIGAFIIGNPKFVIGKAAGAMGHALKGPKYSKDDYLELLSLMYAIFKLAKSKGCWPSNRISKTLRRATSWRSFLHSIPIITP